MEGKVAQTTHTPGRQPPHSQSQPRITDDDDLHPTQPSCQAAAALHTKKRGSLLGWSKRLYKTKRCTLHHRTVNLRRQADGQGNVDRHPTPERYPTPEECHTPTTGGSLKSQKSADVEPPQRTAAKPHRDDKS